MQSPISVRQTSILLLIDSSALLLSFCELTQQKRPGLSGLQALAASCSQGALAYTE